MNLLLPLGLLGLLGLAALILIYIIKPNYQQKLVSSTYVWKLSLKYKKKKIPVSRISSLLIFICQFLILAACAFLLAKPVIPFERVAPRNEKVAIIDASASMLISSNGETRFERAVYEVKELAQNTLSGEDGAISVIVADENPYLLMSRLTSDNLSEIEEKLDELILPVLKCSYGSADMESAAELAEEVLAKNSETEVIFYTATNYIDKGSFTVVDVSDEDDWNVAILGCTPVLEDSNCYSFSVDVGCYGRSKSVTVYCEIYGANGQTEILKAEKSEYFNLLESKKSVDFTTDDFDGKPIVSFESMYLYVDENDPFARDNVYNVYGGMKPTIKIQYSSSKANNFFGGVLRTLRETKKSFWNITIKEVSAGGTAETEGYDLYIFEHSMPETLPTDGVVLLVDPDKEPTGAGLRLGDKIETGDPYSTISSGIAHPLTANVNPENITVAQYRKILSSDGYEELLYYHGDPVMLAKNETNTKVVVLSIDLNMSSLGIVLDFPVMMYNIFNYYFPSTLTKNAFEIGDTVVLNARGEDLTVDGEGLDGKLEIEELPSSMVLEKPGSYTVTQKNMKGEYVVEQFFVRIPNSESDITKNVDALPLLRAEITMVQDNRDLLIYIAAAVLALMFVEWWLHSRESF